MKFGPVALSEAEGTVLAHSVPVSGRRLRKGRVLTAQDVADLAEAGAQEVIVAALGPDDVAEDEAARQLAEAVLGGASGMSATDPFTGRVNVLAAGPGVVELDVAALEAINRIDPMITIATVPPWQQMAARGMVATIKIISYAVPRAALEAAKQAAGQGAMRFHGPVHKAATLIITDIPGGAGDKGKEAVEGRLNALDVTLTEVVRVPHRTAALQEAIGAAKDDLVLILTGSATSDIDDVAPSALRAAAGQIERFGMPVDPGNLLFLGARDGQDVIGLPGCARAPALNGADWVLSRVACGIDVTPEDIAGMGVGGLLKEIPTRPMPRRGRGKSRN